MFFKNIYFLFDNCRISFSVLTVCGYRVRFNLFGSVVGYSQPFQISIYHLRRILKCKHPSRKSGRERYASVVEASDYKRMGGLSTSNELAVAATHGRVLYAWTTRLIASEILSNSGVNFFFRNVIDLYAGYQFTEVLEEASHIKYVILCAELSKKNSSWLGIS